MGLLMRIRLRDYNMSLLLHTTLLYSNALGPPISLVVIVYVLKARSAAAAGATPTNTPLPAS